MKRSAILAVFFFVTFGIQAQQSISLPAVVPTHCTSQTCKFIVYPNMTAILIAKQSGAGTITDSLGGTWAREFCIDFDNGDCQFQAQLNTPYPVWVTLTFPTVGYSDIYIHQYQGKWNFVAGQQGTYQSQNSVFPDCTNEQNCQYNWTLPVEADAGNLLIAFSNSQSTGPGLPTAGLGWSIEANDGFLATEDMIVPIGGVPYIGSLAWKNIDGSLGGGSHWLMGIGVYKRAGS